MRQNRAQRSPRVSLLARIRPHQVHRLITNTLKTLPAGFSSWSDWGAWSECDFSCSCSKKFRHRTCVASTNAACEGDSMETASCSTGTANTTSLSTLFFDFAFTNSNETRDVTCCHLSDNSPQNTTCGKGVSCAGGCAALESSLCPSGRCTEDPKTCDIKFDDNELENEETGTYPVIATGSNLKWCANSRYQCRVRKHPECCYYPSCLNEKNWPGRKDACAWLNYLTGKKCPLPGSLPHGSWTCEVQEVPIHGATFLDEGAQTYPALQCRLECEPGYVAQRTPIITCVNGEYEPFNPSAFGVCIGELSIF